MIQDLVLDGPHGELPVRTYHPSVPARAGDGTDGPVGAGDSVHGAVPAGVEHDDGAPVPPPGSAPALVWAHGGAFARGDLDMAEADWLARRLAARGIAVVSVDYRLAPLNGDARWGGEVRPGVHFPVPLEELAYAHAWTREHAHELGADRARVAIGGASAGANLAAGATLRLLSADLASHPGGDAPGAAVPWRVLLAYPTLHAIQPPVGEELRLALAEAELTDQFAPTVVRAFYENYLGPAGPAESAPLEAVPGTATTEQLAGFPPSCITVAELDELRVSAEAFAATLRQAGADVELVVEPAATHGYLNRPDEEPRAVDTVERFAALLIGDHALPSISHEDRDFRTSLTKERSHEH